MTAKDIQSWLSHLPASLQIQLSQTKDSPYFTVIYNDKALCIDTDITGRNLRLQDNKKIK